MNNYYFEIASMKFVIQAPFELQFGENMRPFRIDGSGFLDYGYRIGRMASDELEGSSLIAKREYFEIYQKQQKIYRRWERKDKGQVNWILLEKSKKTVEQNLLISTESIEKSPPFLGKDIMMYLGMEDIWLLHNAFLLHASCIRCREKGILFSACSGSGKSTQAELWKKYETAEILNGDRTLIRREGGRWNAYGSPLAGSSKIYCNQSAPISAIIVLSKGKENRIQKLSGKEAFISLYRETLMNTWNPEYMEAMTDLLLVASKEIPVYHLSCRPEREAVELVKQMLNI